MFGFLLSLHIFIPVKRLLLKKFTLVLTMLTTETFFTKSSKRRQPVGIKLQFSVTDLAFPLAQSIYGSSAQLSSRIRSVPHTWLINQKILNPVVGVFSACGVTFHRSRFFIHKMMNRKVWQQRSKSMTEFKAETK